MHSYPAVSADRYVAELWLFLYIFSTFFIVIQSLQDQLVEEIPETAEQDENPAEEAPSQGECSQTTFSS